MGVLSIDPSSPFTEGALLGDRIRLAEHFLDEGVYIRSMASRGALGGLSEATLQAVLLMDASGKEDVLVETVGVGQAEIDIIDHADTIVLALMPGSGDSVQALKAGVMEIPDVIVVNKANHPLTDTMVREIRGVLALGPVTDWKVPIVKTEATEGSGVEELAEAIDAHHAHITEAGHARGAARAQPAQRGAGPGRRAAAARARALAARRPERAGAARPGRAPRGRSRPARQRNYCGGSDEQGDVRTSSGDLGEVVIADPPPEPRRSRSSRLDLQGRGRAGSSESDRRARSSCAPEGDNFSAGANVEMFLGPRRAGCSGEMLDGFIGHAPPLRVARTVPTVCAVPGAVPGRGARAGARLRL